MLVLKEILKWSETRPSWQRDALRRLVLADGLASEDILELVEICKATHGLAEHRSACPVQAQHLPNRGHAAGAVSLSSIYHHRGVNALAERQTLTFSPSLTIVYGDNAAGKTGYIRILKNACRARGQEQILGNVTAATTPVSPVVAIKYQVGTKGDLHEWAGRESSDDLSRVSVFDARSASVYLNEKLEAAFRPFALDLFDKLVQACKSVRSQLEGERRLLATSSLDALKAVVPADTAVARLLENVTSLTRPETVEELANISSEDLDRLTFLEQSSADRKANDPRKVVQELMLRGSRLRALGTHLERVESALSDEVAEEMLEARREERRIAGEAKYLREETLRSEQLNGTGMELWGVLWEAARRFSEESAYESQRFPAIDVGARCVLCQQDLDGAAKRRLTRFEEFVASNVEQELRRVRQTIVQNRDTVASLEIRSLAIDETLEEVRIQDEPLANRIASALDAAEERRRQLTVALSGDAGLGGGLRPLLPMAGLEAALERRVRVRVDALRDAPDQPSLSAMTAELSERRARQLLAQQKQVVLGEVDRKRRHAAYGLCIDDTRTQGITRKASAVTRQAVTETLKESFQRELARLNFRHVEVELKEVGGSDGVLYHRIALARAPGVELPRVVSEGEQRCLSIAAFLAELTTADKASAIVFDDPVSSLDYKWRREVARRLVEEAGTRQVIVFTHDVGFLLALKQLATEKRIEQRDQHVRHLATGAGVCTQELPWIALKVSKRMGYLKKRWQDADRLHRDGH